VARGEEPLRLAYQAAGREALELGGDAAQLGAAELEARLHAALQARLPRDRERGFTSVGPHADDVAIGIGARSARLYASQGQTRALVLAFKIGEIENLKEVQGRAPLLLLDDVSSELDPARNGFLMRYLASLRGQVVLTTTDAQLVAAAALPAEAAATSALAGPPAEAGPGPGGAGRESGANDPAARFFSVLAGRIAPADPPGRA
jgi:DNA replication and repair protein RecF